MTNVYFNALGVDLENLPGKKNALAEQRPFFYFHGMEDWQVFEFLSKCTYEEIKSFQRFYSKGVGNDWNKLRETEFWAKLENWRKTGGAK